MRPYITAVLIAVTAVLPTSGARAVPLTGVTTVTLWTWSPPPRTVDKMIGAFEAAHPTIKVDYTNYDASPQYAKALTAAARAASCRT